MVKKKGKSGRITLKDKYKIQRRVTETNRKNRKKAKRDFKAGIVKHDKKKDPGIPNSWPFKQELLEEIGRARERAEEEKKNSKQQKRSSLQDLMGKVAQSQAAFDAKQQQQSSASQNNNSHTTDDSSTAAPAHGQQSRRAYLRECRKVLENSDVILQVLDARDPIGTRIGRSTEDAILSRADRRMVLVLNKVDLIPKSSVSEWLTYLRRSHPTIAVKAGKKHSGGGQSKGDGALLQSASAVGMEAVLQLMKNYARNGGNNSKGSITVGVIGYPNVGKSSIINSLLRTRAVGVSPRPGFTTCMQEVVLDRNIRLLDSPGVVFDDDDQDSSASVLLRNCVDVDTIEDPIPVMQELLHRCTRESLMMTYAIPAFPQGNADIFLAMVAKKLGRVRKGGIPDKVIAARTVLRDWNGGKIPYYTPVPSSSSSTDMSMDGDGTTTGANNGKSTAFVVSEFSKEFDVQLMNSLDDDKDEMDFVQLAPSSASSKKCTQTTRLLTEEAMSEEENDDMEDVDQDKNGMESGKLLNDSVKDAEDYDFEDM